VCGLVIVADNLIRVENYQHGIHSNGVPLWTTAKCKSCKLNSPVLASGTPDFISLIVTAAEQSRT